MATADEVLGAVERVFGVPRTRLGRGLEGRGSPNPEARSAVRYLACVYGCPREMAEILGVAEGSVRTARKPARAVTEMLACMRVLGPPPASWRGGRPRMQRGAA